MRIPSHRFQEHSLNFSGSTTRSPQAVSNVTQAREQAMQAIYDRANSTGVPVDYVVTQVMNNNQDNLRSFVMASGETPLSDPTALALQAVMIRAAQVGIVADALDISDEDALQVLENNLQEDIDTNSPEVDNSLNMSNQAAVACAMDYMSRVASNNSLPSSMSGVSKMLPAAASKFRQAAASSSANNDDSSDTSDTGDLSEELSAFQSSSVDPASYSDPTDDAAVSSALSPASISSSLAAIPGVTGVNPSVTAGVPSISYNASTLPQAGTQTTAGGVLNSISSMLSSISNIANQATNTSSTLSKALSGVGSNSIGTYIQNNQSSIFIIVIIVVVVVILAANARK